MTDHEHMHQFQSLVENSKIILVIYGATPTVDERATAHALYQSFQQAGKDVSLYAPKEPENEQNNQDMVTKTEIGHQNLVISFDYSEEAVDKVSYHIGEETGRFYLTIKPKRGHEPLDAKSVDFSYTGAEADLILLVGVNKLENLEQLYYGYEDVYRNTPIVTFSNGPSNIGTISFGARSSAISESTTRVIQGLGYTLEAEVATQLLQGIEDTTNNFQSRNVTADTFETVAHLLRNGAVRQQQATSQADIESTQELLGKRAPKEKSPVHQVSSWKDQPEADTEMKVVREKKREQKAQEEKPNGPAKRSSADTQSKSKNTNKQPTPNQPPRGVSKK